jgi:hypothetical protein
MTYTPPNTSVLEMPSLDPQVQARERRGKYFSALSKIGLMSEAFDRGDAVEAEKIFRAFRDELAVVLKEIFA